MMDGSSFVTVALDGIKNTQIKVKLIPHPKDGRFAQIQLIGGEKKITTEVIDEYVLSQRPSRKYVEKLLADKYSFLLKLKKMSKRYLIRKGEVSPMFL